MCVIAFAPKGVKAPTEEQIRAMFTANPDGAGFAYNGKGGEVFFEKGFMNVSDLLERLKPLDQWTNTNFAIHFRIGTAGKNDEKTCHPFPISTDLGDLRKTSGQGSVLFHNGILASGGWADSLSSDTQDFVIAFAPMLAKYNKSSVRAKWLESVSSSNRLLTMYKGNKFNMYGDWKKDGDLWVSNTHYQTYMYSYGTYSTYGYAYNSYDDDYYTGVGGKFGAYWDSKAEQEREEEEFEEIVAEMDSVPAEMETALADSLYEELWDNGYAWTNEEEARILKRYADTCKGDYFSFSGTDYYYDQAQGIVYELAEV